MSRTASGDLLIADIIGYTQYLSSSELEHAQEVLKSLMELLIDPTLPPLRVAGLRGDAVFSYGLSGLAQGGQALVEMIEETYVALRRAVEQMVINTSWSTSWSSRRLRPPRPSRRRSRCASGVGPDHLPPCRRFC